MRILHIQTVCAHLDVHMCMYTYFSRGKFLNYEAEEETEESMS